MSTSSILLVMADSTHARIYRQAKRGYPLAFVEKLEHPESATPSRMLLTDRPGRTEGGFPGQFQEHAPHTGRHEEEMRRFARTLGGYIEKARAKGEFAELILIASPRMLGMLRDELSPESTRSIALSLAQDLMHLDEPTLMARIKEVWWMPAQMGQA